jgi:hypothetical protein
VSRFIDTIFDFVVECDVSLDSQRCGLRGEPECATIGKARQKEATAVTQKLAGQPSKQKTLSSL